MGQSVMQEDWFAVFKFRVTVKAQIIKFDCFYHIYWTAYLFATAFNWMVHHHNLECFLLKLDCSFKVKNTVQLQNLIESLCISYLLYQWSLGNQTRCADLLLIISKPITTKWAYTDSSTLTYTIIRLTVGGEWGVFCCAWQHFCVRTGAIRFF